MPQGQLKGSLIRESASDRLCGFSPSGHLQYNSPGMFNSLLTLLELPSMNILWILHSSQLCKFALSPIPGDAEFQYVTPQSLTISQVKFSRNLRVRRPTAALPRFAGHFPHHNHPRNDLMTPFVIKHSNTKHFRDATCFRVKTLNRSGPSCFCVVLLQHPPEPAPVGVTQTANSGYLASTWNRSYHINQGERPEPAEDGALKTPPVDGPAQEEDPPQVAEGKVPKKEEDLGEKDTQLHSSISSGPKPSDFPSPHTPCLIHQQIMSALSSKYIQTTPTLHHLLFCYLLGPSQQLLSLGY